MQVPQFRWSVVPLIAAEGSHLFLTMCFSRTSPFPVGRVMYSRTTTRFSSDECSNVCLDDQIYDVF